MGFSAKLLLFRAKVNWGARALRNSINNVSFKPYRWTHLSFGWKKLPARSFTIDLFCARLSALFNSLTLLDLRIVSLQILVPYLLMEDQVSVDGVVKQNTEEVR